MVSFTPQGSQLLEDIKEAMGFLEKEIENRIGVREFDKMAKVLDDYILSIKSDPLSIKVYRTHVSKKRNGKSPV